MTDDQIITAVTEILAEIAEVEATEVRPESAFGTDLDVDSLLMVEVLVVVEEVFSIRLPEDGAQELACVADLVRVVGERLGVA